MLRPIRHFAVGQFRMSSCDHSGVSHGVFAVEEDYFEVREPFQPAGLLDERLPNLTIENDWRVIKRFSFDPFDPFYGHLPLPFFFTNAFFDHLLHRWRTDGVEVAKYDVWSA